VTGGRRNGGRREAGVLRANELGITPNISKQLVALTGYTERGERILPPLMLFPEENDDTFQVERTQVTT